MFPQDIEILSWFPVGPVLGASLALVGHPSSDGVNKNALWDRCFTWTSFAPHLPNGLVKNESGFIVRSVETNAGDERWLREMNAGGNCD